VLNYYWHATSLCQLVACWLSVVLQEKSLGSCGERWQAAAAGTAAAAAAATVCSLPEQQ
jgi:hypothetical protein